MISQTTNIAACFPHLARLAQLKDKKGDSFLSAEECRAAQKLRQDYERSQMGQNITQNWDRFLAPVQGGQINKDPSLEPGFHARERLRKAATYLGAGLAECVIDFCCLEQGIEVIEQKRGWSARSGKVVLKIALQQLARFYGTAVYNHHTKMTAQHYQQATP